MSKFTSCYIIHIINVDKTLIEFNRLMDEFTGSANDLMFLSSSKGVESMTIEKLSEGK
jgi:hypothetical protein